MKQAVKLGVFLFLCTMFIITALPFYPFLSIAPWKIRKILTHMVRYYLWLFAKVFGIKVNLVHGNRYHDYESQLLVANHLSYVDILTVVSVIPTCFVTSVEMRDTPFLGHICRLAGCLFVERRSRENLMNEIKELEQALANGLNVVIFPEATSTNGEAIKRFKRPLFQSAIATGRPVLPMTLNYRKLDGTPITAKNRDFVFWYDDMTFFGHLWHFLSFSKIEVDIHVAEAIKETKNSNPTDLSAQAQALVEKNYQPIVNL